HTGSNRDLAPLSDAWVVHLLFACSLHFPCHALPWPVGCSLPACFAMHAVTVARMSSLQCEWSGRPSVLTDRENAPVALAMLCWHLRPARMLWCSGPFTLRPAAVHTPE